MLSFLPSFLCNLSLTYFMPFHSISCIYFDVLLSHFLISPPFYQNYGPSPFPLHACNMCLDLLNFCFLLIFETGVIYWSSDLLISLSSSASCLPLNLKLQIYLSIYLYMYLFIYLSIYLSFYLSIYLSIYLYIYLTNYLSIHISTHLSVHLFIYLSMYLAIYPYMYLSKYMFVS